MRFNRTIKASSRKPVCASDLTDEQAHMLVDLSDFAADIIKDTEKDYGKKLSQNGWAQVMDYTEDLVRDPSFVKKTVGNDLASMKMHLEAVIYDIYEEDTGIEGIYESTKINQREVEASMKKRPVSAAMTDEEFYTRKFPTVKVGEVKVAPQRGNWTVFIGLSDGTIAYQWCESKVAAERESEYAKSIVKKYGSDAPYWVAEGYKIWNPNVKSAKKSVSCARRFTVKASTARKRKRVCADERKPFNIPSITESLKADVENGVITIEDAARELYEANMIPWVDIERAKRRLGIKSAKSVKCSTKRRCSIKASNVPESDVDELYRIANNEVLPTTKLYKIAGICDIDDDTFDFTYTGTAFGAYLTYIIHVGISSSDIDLYTFMRKEWDDLFPDISCDNPYGNYVQINLDVMVSGDRISVDIADADVYEKDTYSEYYSKKFARAFDIEAIEDHIKGIAEQAVDKIQATLSQYIPEDEDIMESSKVRSRKRVSASKRMRKSIKASADYGSQSYKVLRVLRDYINMEFNKTMIGDVEVYVGDIYETANDAFAFDVSLDPQNDYERETQIKVVSSDELYEKDVFYCKVGLDVRNGGYFEISRFGAKGILADKIDEIAESISSGDSVESAKSIKCGAVRKDDSVDPIDSEFMVDLYYSPNHKGRAGDRYFYDWSEAESYAHDALMNGLYVSIWNKNNGDILDISPDEYNEAWENGAADFDINEDIVNFKRRIVESAKSIKCAAEEGFHLYAYDMDGADVSTAFAKTKKEIKDAVDDLFSYDETDTVDVYEGGMSGFGDLIKTYTRNDVEAAKSVTCSDNSDLTVDISNLELGEPYYEYREDDPENPDKWVLVIGKDVDKQMNFKLWYYMDTTDADLSELDLSNPDHIDLDEMSTMDDYEEIQLSQDIKCSTVTDMHGNQVNLVTL